MSYELTCNITVRTVQCGYNTDKARFQWCNCGRNREHVSEKKEKNVADTKSTHIFN